MSGSLAVILIVAYVATVWFNSFVVAYLDERDRIVVEPFELVLLGPLFWAYVALAHSGEWFAQRGRRRAEAANNREWGARYVRAQQHGHVQVIAVEPSSLGNIANLTAISAKDLN